MAAANPRLRLRRPHILRYNGSLGGRNVYIRLIPWCFSSLILISCSARTVTSRVLEIIVNVHPHYDFSGTVGAGNRERVRPAIIGDRRRFAINRHGKLCAGIWPLDGS